MPREEQIMRSEQWRSIISVSLISALAIAPLLVFATVRGGVQTEASSGFFTLSATTWKELGRLYLGFTIMCFGLLVAISALIVYLTAMIDRVPSPFPKPAMEKLDE